MKLESYSSSVPSSLEESLESFEKEFLYPLGNDARFRISHEPDYLRFFRAMGKPTLCVAQDHRGVLGSIVRVERTLDSGGERKVIHYLCDLKLRASFRGSTLLARLILQTKRDIEASDSTACYCVVMEGTGRSPADYTGRLGVPKFERIADIFILRLSAKRQMLFNGRVVSEEEFAENCQTLHGGSRIEGGDRGLRSKMIPAYLLDRSGDACGVLEDTRMGKRLIMESGSELVSAHLSSFAYRNPKAAGNLLKGAVSLAGERGMPAVFAAIPIVELPRLLPYLGDLHYTVAPAAIYGHGLETRADWWIDPAEI